MLICYKIAISVFWIYVYVSMCPYNIKYIPVDPLSPVSAYDDTGHMPNKMTINYRTSVLSNLRFIYFLNSAYIYCNSFLSFLPSFFHFVLSFLLFCIHLFLLCTFSCVFSCMHGHLLC